MSKPSFLAVAGGVLAAVALVASGGAAASAASVRGAHASSTATAFLSSLHTVTTIGSTVPANGDINPYGLAVVGSSVGSLKAGDFTGVAGLFSCGPLLGTAVVRGIVLECSTVESAKSSSATR